jgi:DNA-binding GntR family transcriptional regulator
MCGRLAPEQPLREAGLAELMGVSRGPIREALSRLESEGLVVTGPTGRTFVARLSKQDLDEVYSLRAALERVAVQYACRHASAADLADMQAVVDTMAAYLQRGISEREAAELDLAFHDTIYRASHHQRLQNVWATLRPQIYVFMLSRNVASADFRESVVNGHEEILSAIKAQAAEAAAAIIDAHMNVAYEHVCATYEQCCPDTEPQDEHEINDVKT